MDASLLVISSRDGFCSILQFEPNELGEVYTHPHIVVTSSSNAVAESAKLENKNMQKDNLVRFHILQANFGDGLGLVILLMLLII